GLVHLLLGETGQGGITSYKSLPLLERQNAVNIVEAVRGTLFHGIDDAFGAAAPVHADYLRGRRKPFLLVAPESVNGVFTVLQAIRQNPRIQNRLRRSVRSDWIHRMSRVPKKRNPAMRPARQRIAIAHRIFPELVRCLDERPGIDLGKAEALDMRFEVL